MGFDKREYLYKVRDIYHDNIWVNGCFFSYMGK